MDPIELNGEHPGVARAYAVVQRMIAPGGCAWHEEQTHESLSKYLVEECYELLDAIESGSASASVSEELGDVLYQVLLHAAIGERDGEGYDLDSVADTLAAKLIARHPHVFGDRGYMSLEELEEQWERLKEDAAGQEHGTRSPLEGVPAGLPSVARAMKVVDRLQRAGIIAETSEATEADEELEARMGDSMLMLIRDALRAGIDPDRALRMATRRFEETHLEK